jgi:hypothetical protein
MRAVLILMLMLLLPIAARAEVVGVKNAGDVDLSALDCTAISESKLLHRVCYDETHHYLVAQIGADYYDSCNVGPKAVDGLFDSEHVVAYYLLLIRAQHRCTAALRSMAGVDTLGRATQSGSAPPACRPRERGHPAVDHSLVLRCARHRRA